MTAEFLTRKNGVRIFSCVLSVFFVFSMLSYAFFLKKAELSRLGKTFYFLVSDSSHIEASTHVAVLGGGAGYVLQTEGREYVAYAVYLTETGAESAQGVMAKNGEKTRVIALKSPDLYSKTRREKLEQEKVNGAFSCFYQNTALLEGEIARLEQGATQESSKRILSVLSRQFAFLKASYGEVCKEYQAACEVAVTALNRSIGGVVYVTDLRYLSCELCVSYIQMSENFCL